MCRVEAVNQKIWNNNLALKRATRQIEWLIDYLIVSLFKLYASVTAIHALTSAWLYNQII